MARSLDDAAARPAPPRGRLHHDINNMLAAILTNLDLCLLTVRGENRRMLEDAQLAARRLKELTDLLESSGRAPRRRAAKR